MAWRIPEVVKCNMASSGWDSLCGAHIDNIKKRVVEEAASMNEEGLLIIQGGKSLLQTECEGSGRSCEDSRRKDDCGRDWSAEVTKRTPV